MNKHTSHKPKSLRSRAAKIGRSVAKHALPAGPFSDSLVARLHFYMELNRWPTRAMLFNDVLFRIKTSGELKNPLRVFVSDKEHVKTYITAKIGNEHNVPTIAVLRTWEEVTNFKFPDQCCIKPTHLSGKVILRKNGEKINQAEVKEWLKTNYYQNSRQANYKDLIPKIIVEPLLFNSTNLSDYKFFCYRGQPKMIQVDSDRQTSHQRCLFDAEWNPLPFGLHWPKPKNPPPRPRNLQSMINAATKLSEDFEFVRIDIYTNGFEFMIGEITNCHGAGAERFIPAQGEAIASELIFGKHTT